MRREHVPIPFDFVSLFSHSPEPNISPFTVIRGLFGGYQDKNVYCPFYSEWFRSRARRY